jgi:ABC-2 type transport system permease protein
VRINWHQEGLLGVIAAVLLGVGCFATLSLLIAALVRTRERFMGVGQIVTMPLFFASDAIYPLGMMPHGCSPSRGSIRSRMKSTCLGR